MWRWKSFSDDIHSVLTGSKRGDNHVKLELGQLYCNEHPRRNDGVPQMKIFIETAVGEALAHELGVPFRDADEFHSPENKCKMSNGIPLTDEDRLPWLQSINKYILEVMHSGSSAVVTCSALKRKYRHILLENCTNTPEVSDIVRIVYLRGSEGVIQERLSKRKGHFMPPALLKSQLMTLEEPDSAEPFCITVNTDNKTVAVIVKEITILFHDLRQNLLI